MKLQDKGKKQKDSDISVNQKKKNIEKKKNSYKLYTKTWSQFGDRLAQSK